MGARTMLFGECAGVLLCVHTSDAPSDAEWDAYVSHCARLPLSCTRTLVMTEGGGPNAAQRKALQQRYLAPRQAARVEPRVAVLTDSAFVRGIVKALAWFNEGTDSFPYFEGTGVAGALRHLRVDELTAQRVAIELEVMRRELARQSLARAS